MRSTTALYVQAKLEEQSLYHQTDKLETVNSRQSAKPSQSETIGTCIIQISLTSIS